MKAKFLITVLLLTISLFGMQNARSQVLVEGSNTSGIHTVPNPPQPGNTGYTNDPMDEITSATISSTPGNAGDYEIVICNAFTTKVSSIPNTVPDVTDISISPGNWELLATIEPITGSAYQARVFGRFTNNETPEDITCSWASFPPPGFIRPPFQIPVLVSNIFVAGYFRYSGVDQADPIINIDCMNTPFTTEANSQVLCVDPQNTFRTANAAIPDVSRAEEMDSINIGITTALDVFTSATSDLLADTQLFVNEGLTGRCGRNLRLFPACTIALRSAPLLPNITLTPDMQEMGIDDNCSATLTSTVLIDGVPQQGVLVEFNIISGPNEGLTSTLNNGECSVNDDCTTDENGMVSWTYSCNGTPGMDEVIASIFSQEHQQTFESNIGIVTWIVIRNVPTLSVYGLIATAGILGIIGLFMIQRRNIGI